MKNNVGASLANCGSQGLAVSDVYAVWWCDVDVPARQKESTKVLSDETGTTSDERPHLALARRVVGDEVLRD